MLELVEATEQHSALLQKFFQEQIVNGHIDYSVIRPNSFFDQYRLLSDDFKTVLLMDGGTLLGAASITFVRGYVNRQEQTFALLSDLRIAQQRLAVQQWTLHFIPHLYKMLEERQCRYVFATMEMYENQAYNALLRPRKLRRNLPHYYLYRKLNLYYFLGRWPFAPDPMPSIRVTHATSADIERICDYMMQKKIGSRLYVNVNPETLQKRFETWPSFSIHNFLIARNHKNEIVGCMAPWNNRDVQQTVVHKYKDEARLLFETLKISSFFRLSQFLPDEGKILNLKYVTHCAVDNAEVFYSLLCRAYAETARGELLVHTNYFGDHITRSPLSFISTKVPYGFYSVFPPEEDLPAFLKPNPFSPPPDFNLVYF